MNNQSSTKITEDTPEYRSVMIQQESSGLPPPMPRAFPMAPLKRSPISKVEIRKQSTTQSRSSELLTWKIGEPIELPSMHRLERTNVYVDDNAQNVANRICDCLQRESIAATFPDDDKNRLVAETITCVRFAVRLFSHEGKVVVEAQRMEGCSFEFSQACRTVLKSAKGVQVNSELKRKFTLPKCIPKECTEQKQQCVKDGVNLAFNLYNQNRLDAKLLAMQSLEQLTRKCECRAFSAKLILSGPFLETLISLVIAQKETKNEFEATPEIQDRHESMERRLALSILANSLMALEQSGELCSVIGELNVFRSNSLHSALLGDLRAADEQPHESCQSARCILYLAKSCHNLKSNLIEQGAINFASFASNQGACRSAMLQNESKKLRFELSGDC